MYYHHFSVCVFICIYLYVFKVLEAGVECYIYIAHISLIKKEQKLLDSSVSQLI